MSVARVVAQTLVAGGVEHAFGVIGSGNFLLANELRDAGTAVYTARHECGAMMMADGYGRATGRIAIATTHQGPGFTNALTAGQTGNVPVDSISISQSQNNATTSWTTPQGACTVSITSNVSDPDSSGFFKNRYSVSGTGSCSQPATADATTTSTGTVTIGAFTFTGFIDPS